MYFPFACRCAFTQYAPFCIALVDFTCTRDNRVPVSKMKSYCSLSPQGFATPNPRLTAFSMKANSAASPFLFVTCCARHTRLPGPPRPSAPALVFRTQKHKWRRPEGLRQFFNPIL